MARLDWSMVIGADGKIGNAMLVADDIAKNGRGRQLPIHPDLKSALMRLHVAGGRPRDGAVIQSQRGHHLTKKRKTEER